ncbi:hypothetical protein FSARC_7222 [Fusarium sarcochroum]|uniref:Major facilitator superfamily (MFS) profile domain-containing protein n=1 Tax=Fusarium sarcochroum TaxID=1208366 RepID=A0A8H4X7I4_9HYPO|nr:hypothetical protein FSARC_7222 [Fusarium sarcochroum]
MTETQAQEAAWRAGIGRLNLLLTVPMMNGLQSVPAWIKDFDNPSGARLGVLGTMQVIGAIVSLPIVPWVADRFGRRLPVFIGSVLALLGTALQTAARNINTFLAGRFFVGFGTGVVGVASNPLLAELAYPTHHNQFLGAVVAAWSTYGTFKLESSWSWRIPSLLQSIPSVYQMLLIYLVPESPRWLISHGKLADARKVLNKYYAGRDTDADISPLMQYEMAEIESAIELEKVQNTNSYLDFLKTSKPIVFYNHDVGPVSDRLLEGNRWRLSIAIILGLSAQWAGNGLVSFYLVIVLRSIGINDPEEQNLINGGLTIFCYIIAITGATGVLRFGRRTILVFGFAGMAASYLVWTILSSINQQKDFKDSSLGYGVVVMIFIFQLFYNISINPVLPTYILEIMPFMLRAKGYTIEQIVTYGAGPFNGFVNPVAMEALEWKYYIVWVVMLCVWLTLIYFLFPETAGRTLEEVSQIFDGVDFASTVEASLNAKGEATELEEVA